MNIQLEQMPDTVSYTPKIDDLFLWKEDHHREWCPGIWLRMNPTGLGDNIDSHPDAPQRIYMVNLCSGETNWVHSRYVHFCKLEQIGAPILVRGAEFS